MEDFEKEGEKEILESNDFCILIFKRNQEKEKLADEKKGNSMWENKKWNIYIFNKVKEKKQISDWNVELTINNWILNVKIWINKSKKQV